MKRAITLLISVFILGATPWASAGSSQAEGESFFDPGHIIDFSKKVEKILAANQARIAIIGRVGRPREDLPKGIVFTHTAIAVYSRITTDGGQTLPGYAIYNLYQKPETPSQSHLIQDFPVDFFSGVRILEAGVIIPTQAMQKRLLAVLASDTYRSLHNSNYSIIANPFNRERQNCTEFILDLLFSAIYKTSDPDVIKKNVKTYFTAQPVHINPLKASIGSLFMSELTVSDHPGKLQTTTFTSIRNFLDQYQLVEKYLVIDEETRHDRWAETDFSEKKPAI